MHDHPLTLIQTRAQELIGRVRFRDLLHKHIFLLRQVAHVSLCVCGERGRGLELHVEDSLKYMQLATN